MDRNLEFSSWGGLGGASLSARRAWIEILAYPDMIICTKSLSARRAWIEMLSFARKIRPVASVALRKESVDRNQRIAKPFREQFKSLSARRAWIEMRA